MRRTGDGSLGKYEVIILSVIAGLSAYIIDAAVDAFIFHDGPFLDVLIFAVPLGETYIRSYILVSFIIFGIFLSRILAKRKKAEKALRESQETLRAQYKGIPIPTYTWQRVEEDFVLVDYNDAAMAITHGNVANFVGKRASEMYKDRPEILEELSRCFAEKTSIKREMLYRFSTGESKHLSVSYGFVPPDRVLVHTEDITERKMLDERLSTLHTYSRDLNTAESREEIYRLTLDAIEKTLGFEIAFFMIADKGMLCVVDHRGYPESFSIKLPLNGTKRGVSVKVAKTGRPIYVPDAEKDDDWVEFMPGIRSGLDVPVKIGRKVLGVIGVDSKALNAFNEKDQELLEILASHAATAISNLIKRTEIEKRSSQLASLMKNSAEMIHSTDLRQRLQKIAEAIRDLGWRRVVISVRDENMEMTGPEDMVTVGLTDEERESLWNNRPPGQVVRERFGPEYERFKIGEFYYLQWRDPWVREKLSKMFTIPSHLKPEEMVDWDPEDLLYAPLRLADGRIVGRLSIDDPLDGKRPTKESLAPLELFLHQAAVAIENAKLIQQLNEAKKEIKEYADQLELKVKQRTQELMEVQNRLLKSERLAAIGEIAAMVGHDLRNPLTGIAGAIYYLKMKAGPKTGKKTREMLELIEEDIEYSNKIIDDLLEYSREMQLELIEATPKIIVKEALSLVKVPKNIQVSDSTESEPRIKIDGEKMKRVFVNIIKNAIDAMPKGGKLTIKSKKIGSSLEIAFTDTGIGMPKDIVEKLWTPLFTTKAKGMGFGLPICKRVVEAHGGNISAESTVGKGTTFTVTIPIEPKLEGGEKIWVNIPESLLSTTTKA